MNRIWSLVFFAVPVLGTLVLVWAILGLPPFQDHWLPDNINRYGHAIDHLFNLILILTGIVFIGTGLALGWLLWKYDRRSNSESAKFIHGSHRAELIWSVIPGIILLFLSLYQIKPWMEVTMEQPTIEVDGETIPKPPLMRVIGRQFNWDFQYAGPDGQLDTIDDLLIVDTICAVPMNEDVVLQLEAEDVLHSFFIPEMRVKQDVVPGMRHTVWLHAEEAKDCEIACTELCGWGHYKMRALMKVLPRDEFDQWIEQKTAELNQAGSTASR